MPRGGARPNSGPKKNPLVKTSREAMVDATKAVGITPAQVMAENLRFWYDVSTSLTDKIEKALASLTPEDVREEPELLRQLNNNLKNMLIARERAQECAVDMAPYRHPRLANIEVTERFRSEDEDGVPRITHTMDPKAAAKAYEESLRK
jgi:hypothetical protein